MFRWLCHNQLSRLRRGFIVFSPSPTNWTMDILTEKLGIKPRPSRTALIIVLFQGSYLPSSP